MRCSIRLRRRNGKRRSARKGARNIIAETDRKSAIVIRTGGGSKMKRTVVSEKVAVTKIGHESRRKTRRVIEMAIRGVEERKQSRARGGVMEMAKMATDGDDIRYLAMMMRVDHGRSVRQYLIAHARLGDHVPEEWSLL